MRIIIPITILLVMLLALSQSVLAVKMYSYIDENGQKVYTQFRPDLDFKAKIIKPPPPPPSTAPVTMSGAADSEASTSQTSDNQAASDKQDQEAKAIRAKNCEIARKNLQLLSAKGKVEIKDEKGNMMNDKQRQSRVKRAKKDVQEYCK